MSEQPNPRPRRGTWIWTTLAAAVLLSVGTLLVAQHYLKGPLLRAAGARAGREIRVEGCFQARVLSLHPSITASDVVVGNPAWMAAGVAAEASKVVVLLQWQFSLHPLLVRRFQIEGARLHLMRDAAGHANWHISNQGPGGGPPLVHSLYMPNAQVELHDQRQHLEFKGVLSAGDAADTPAAPLRIVGAGQLNGREASFAVDAEPLATVRRDQPYHFTFEERSGPMHIEGRGFLEHPFDFRRLQLSFEAAGPDLKDIYYLVGLSLPDTGSFRASGKLARNGKRFEYSDLAVSSGSSDLAGTLNIESSGGRSRIEGELTARVLKAADIGARAAGRASATDTQPDALRLPQTPLRLSGLRRGDALIKVRVADLQFADQTLHGVSGLVRIEHAALSLEHARASLGDGMLSGSARLDAAHELPQGELDLTLDALPLDQLRGASARPLQVSGPLSARIQLRGSGKSLHELAASADGAVRAVLPRGNMRAAVADAAALDLSGALGLMRKSQEQTDIRCGVANLEAHEGVLTLRTLVLDTERSLITGEGEVHMDDEALDLTLRGRPKKAQLALRSDVAIRGTLRDPQLRLSGSKGAAQAGAAAALAVILTPVAAVLALVNPGLAHDADCAALLAEAQVPGATTVAVAQSQ